MNHSVSTALINFSSRFIALYKQDVQSLPRSTLLAGADSPCVVEDHQQAVIWQPVTNPSIVPLAEVEKGMELRLHEDIHAFYGTQLSADLPARFEAYSLELLQVFNDDDRQGLQANILAHLAMQRRLKLKPTVFIAALGYEEQLISICNLTEQVLLERVGTGERDILASDVAGFLEQLVPVVNWEA